MIAIIVSAAGAATANPITLELISDSSISGLNATLGQELTLGPSLNEWHFGQANKELVAISSDATKLAVTRKNFGITDSCFYVVTPAETTATPEPISMLLLGTGLLGTAAGIRYRRRKSVSNS